MFTVASFMITKNQKQQSKYPSANECIKKMEYIYVMEYYFAITCYNTGEP